MSEEFDSLDLDPDEFRALGYRTVDMIAEYFDGIDDRPVFPGNSQSEVERVFEETLPEAGQDADSILCDDWIERALARFSEAPDVGAVGGVFVGESGGGLLGALQRMEYQRYARELARTGKVWVLTGTATMFRAEALTGVAESRGDHIPGQRGDVYDRDALTEDMEITVALRTLGWRVASPSVCRVTTEVMPTVVDLWRQRIRWQRGALENLRSYGWRRSTRPYFGQQCLMALSVLVMMSFLGLSVFWAATDQWGWSWFGGTVALLFVTERVATVWPLGLRHRLIATPLVIELAYDLFQQVVLVRAATDALLSHPQQWHHVAAEH